MHMHSFNWSTDIGEFFFDGLNISNACLLAILCGVLCFVSLIYEGMKVHTAKVRARAAREQIRAVSCAPSETANLLVTDQNGPKQAFSQKFCKLFNEAIVFLMHTSIGYFLMLAVMIYNGWIFLTVVLSMGLGYFLFGHVSMKINMENVQARTTKVICSPACPADSGNSSVPNASKNSSAECSPARVVVSSPPCVSTISCHQEKVTPAVNPELEGDCSCRL